MDLICQFQEGHHFMGFLRRGKVRDYWKYFSEGLNVVSGDSSPTIKRVSLIMSLENIVKDIPAISDNDWTYGDLMEVESRILKAIQPQLCLDPTPQLDRISENPVQSKHIADLLAEQYCSLMIREDYHVEDLVQPKPVRMNPTPMGQLNASGVAPGGAASEMLQFSEGVSMQPSGDIAKPSNSGNAPVNLSSNVQGPRILPPGSTQAIQMSQGLLPGFSVPLRPQQSEQLPPMQQKPLPHHPQFQRSPMILPANTIQHLNNIAQN